MDSFKSIEKKLHQFTRKYYTSELIKGALLFFSLGVLYFFLILLLEHFLWLKPTERTLLFCMFLGVELVLLIRFIAFPVLKLFGLQKGLTDLQSSKIIGQHFPEVRDKLLNALQLKQSKDQSDLLIASIDQKLTELAFVPFTNAVDFTQNKRYLKYAIFPILIWISILFTGSDTVFKHSFERVVNYRTIYVPPPPFSFYLSSTNLEVVQGESISIRVNAEGSVVPSEARIHFEGQQYYLKNKSNGVFAYTFANVQKSFTFYITSNGVQSQVYKVEVINTPTINNISLDLIYPKYLGKPNETLTNSSNITVPEGTNITWKVSATQTDSVAFISRAKKVFFKSISEQNFIHAKNIKNELNYQITSSNNYLKDFESLQFRVGVIKDEYPNIFVQTNISDSIQETAEFAGQISDDYGITNFQIVLYEEGSPQERQMLDLQITNNNIQTFFYQFPDGLNLQKGINYQFFFQVFDNDAINGSKKTTSTTFTYRKKTTEELQQELLQGQRNAIHNIEDVMKDQQQHQKELSQIQKELYGKKKFKWSDKKKLQKLIDRQQKYTRMFQRQTTKLKDNFGEKKEENQQLQNKKEALQQRLKELQKLQKQQKLLDEIQKLADKLDKEDLLKKAKELAQHNRQQERSLSRILELTKRFYIEQKTMQIAKKIEKLSLKQQKEINKKEPVIGAQQQINKEFKAIKETLKELERDNENLKEPMRLADLEEEKGQVDSALQKAEKNILEQKSVQAKQHQQNASKKLKKMSAKMQQAMLQMQGQSMEENIDDLRKILENLVLFSYKQEQLMYTFTEGSTSHPDFGEDLKRQHQLKTYFQHIDDSLYVLSMRLPNVSATIKNDLSTTHFNLDQSLENFSENNFSKGVSNQRYVMMSVNNLANYLSNILNNMKTSMSMQFGSQKKKNESKFRLPDLIKTQRELSKKMMQGMQQSGDNTEKLKKGNGSKEEGVGSKGDANERLEEELYEIYKQQSFLRQELQEQFNNSSLSGKGTNSVVKKALKTMEDLENEILQKGFHRSTLQKMQRLSYDLLQLENASLEQGADKKRTSQRGYNTSKKEKSESLKFKKQFYNQTEILNRQSLPLQQNYKKKVRAYFSKTNI